MARRLVSNVSGELSNIEPRILTGVESLSRNSEHEQMMLFINDLTLFNNIPEPMMATMKLNDMAKILATNRGIEHDKFMKTKEEVEEERKEVQKRAQQQQFAEAAAGAAGQQAGAPPQPVA